MIDYTEIERPAEPHSSDDYPDQWQEVLAWEIARAEKAEALVKELEEDLKGEAMELQAKKILLNNAGLTISKYQSKLSDVTLEWIAATERAKELEGVLDRNHECHDSTDRVVVELKARVKELKRITEFWNGKAISLLQEKSYGDYEWMNVILEEWEAEL
jgi:hypothetical protein